MKQVFKVNINGQYFKIKNEAYTKLQLFIENYRLSIENDKQKELLAQQMENKIAIELTKLCKNTDCIIDINILTIAIENASNNSTTYVFDENAPNSSSNQKNNSYYNNKTNNNSKRLFRNAHSRVIGGVCSGLSNYFNIDKGLVRLLFIVLFFITAGFAIFLYIIICIATPLSFDAQNTHKKYKNDYFRKKKHIKDTNQFKQSNFHKSKNVLARVFGLIIMIFGFLILSALIATIVFSTKIFGIIPAFNHGLIINHIVGESFGPTMILALFLITAIPVLMIIYAGIKLLFNYVANSRAVFLTALSTWIIAIIVAVGMISGIFNDFKTINSTTQHEIISNKSDTLFITINQKPYNNLSNIKFELNNYKIALINNNEQIIARPTLSINKSASDQILFSSKKSAYGTNPKKASYEAKLIIHQFNILADTLFIDPYFTLANEHKWRKQSVELKLEVPKGKILYLDQSLIPILKNAKNEQNIWEPDMTGFFWEMGNNELSSKQQ